jgi:hypothetical protein
LRGLGSAEAARSPIRARSNLGKKPYCVSSNNGKRQTNSSANSDPFAHTGPTGSSTSNPSRSTATSATSSSSPGQSNFRLAQSYVSGLLMGSVPVSARERFFFFLTFFFSFRSQGVLSFRDGTSLPAGIRPTD